MIRFGIVGTGWRSIFFLRVAAACADRFECVGLVSRNPEREKHPGSPYGVRLYGSAEEMVSSRDPLFTVTSVPRTVNPEVIRTLVDLGQPVLSETPPAASVEEMSDLCALACQGAKIQVAEQYHLQPHHAARIAYAQSGRLGQITQAQVSAAHGYHGISLIRRLLGIGFEDAVVTARKFKSPIVKSPNRDGPPTHEEISETTQQIASFDFGDRLGVFDFVGDQYFSSIRNQRVLVRGVRGEIINETATYLEDHTTPIEVAFRRHEAGPIGNLEGNHLKGYTIGDVWIYRNPLAPGELSDDEIAVGDCMLRMAEHARGGPGFYSLAEACQDQYLTLMMEEAERTGRLGQTERQGWLKK